MIYLSDSINSAPTLFRNTVKSKQCSYTNLRKRNTLIKMQATSCFVQPLFPSKSATKNFVTSSPLKQASKHSSSIKAVSVAFEPLAFNYNSPFSVFPAEACETIGGEACSAYMFPEAKLNKQQGANASSKTAVEEVDREYFDYNSEPNSVLRAEACDDLGGVFCEGPYNYRYAVLI